MLRQIILYPILGCPKYDDVQMDFFTAVLKCISVEDIVKFIKAAQTLNIPERLDLVRIFNWKQLPIEDRPVINYVDLIDSRFYFTGVIGKNSRWRINNNLLGMWDFVLPLRERV